MRAFLQILWLELRRIFRTHVFHILAAASIAWVLLVPYVLRTDGTAAGAQEMLIKFSLGGVFTLASISLGVSAAASLAREREEKRLSLDRTRPVARISLALARASALSAAGAIVIFASSAIVAAQSTGARNCSHVLSPVMESLEDEAKRMYDYYMQDPETPQEIKATKRSTLMRILRQGALDHYQTIATNATASWRFAIPPSFAGAPFAVRLRFTNDFDLRENVRGEFTLGSRGGEMQNITQAIVTVPLTVTSAQAGNPEELRFRNDGASTLMLRPRRDIHLLAEADGFAWNLLRADIELVSMLAAIIAFGMFLGAGLGRPVAVFTLISFMFVSIAAEDVIAEYPDQFETDRVDRIGLALTRTVELASRPVASLRPISALAAGDCIEQTEVAAAFAADAIAIPLILSILAAFAISLKEDR